MTTKTSVFTPNFRDAIEAVRWTGENIEDIDRFINKDNHYTKCSLEVLESNILVVKIESPQIGKGLIVAPIFSWVVRDIPPVGRYITILTDEHFRAFFTQSDEK